jgi:hypothetical protein
VGKFFEYKRGLYMVTQPEDAGNSSLYLNGDRGAADVNSGAGPSSEPALSYLLDGTKAGVWADDEFNGCYVLITDGPGSAEQQNWREITDTDGTNGVLVVSPYWKIAHTTSTEYVILASDKWTQLVADLGQYITDVEVGGEYIWMACGGESGDNGIIRYRYYNSSGTWTAESYTTANSLISDKLLMINNPAEGETLWSSTTGETYHNIGIYKGLIGKDKYSSFNLHYPVTRFDTTIPWEDSVISNVTQSTNNGHTRIAIATGHTTGLAAVLNLDTAIDFTAGDAFVAEIKSSAAKDAGDLQFVYDDVYDLSENSAPSKIFHNVAFAAANTYTDKTSWYDGKATSATDSTISWADGDLVLIGYSKPFNKITWDIGATPNAVDPSTMAASYYDGTKFTAVSNFSDGTSSAGITLAQDGTMSWTMPEDWQQCTVNSTEAYWIMLNGSATLTNNVIVQEIYVTRESNVAVNIPALTANDWTTVTCSFADPNYYPDETSIKSIGLNVVNDEGAVNIEIRNLWLSTDPGDSGYIKGGRHRRERLSYDNTFNLPDTGRVNGLQAYAGNVDDPVLNPWILTENGVYEIQTQNDDQIVALPLGEIGALASPDNGQGHCTNNTYLYFNLGEKIQRYYNRTLDDIGPDRDEGLPTSGASRAGIPRTLDSYPGRVYAGIDAGSSGISSVLALKGTAWHEVYRAPQSGQRIRSIYVQAIPGTNVDRLWISMGSDVIWVPISLHPYNEPDYRFTHEGHVITSWFYANLVDVQKLWKSLKLFTEDTSGGDIYVAVDYQVDVETSWTNIGTFNTDPVEEIDIAATHPQARRIRFRLRLNTNNAPTTPRVKALVVEGVAFVPVKYQISFTFEVADGRDVVNLRGIKETTADLSAEEKYDKLVDWANSGQELTLRMNWPMHDNKKVFIDPPTFQPLQFTPKGTSGNTAGREVHAAQLTTIEV